MAWNGKRLTKSRLHKLSMEINEVKIRLNEAEKGLYSYLELLKSVNEMLVRLENKKNACHDK